MSDTLHVIAISNRKGGNPRLTAAGQPVRYFAPKCRGAQDLAELAASLTPVLA